MELGLEEGAPEEVVGALAHGAGEPLVGGDGFEGFLVGGGVEEGEGGGHSNAVLRWEWREVEDAEGGVGLPEAAVVEDGVDGAGPVEVRGEAELLDEGDDAGVGAEDVVVELVEVGAAVRELGGGLEAGG